MPPAPHSGLSLPAQVANELREAIIAGRLLPGTALAEVELAAAYSTSRNTLREALHQLSREGLASYVRNKGVEVRRLGVAEVRDLFKVRRTLELQALRSGAPLREEQAARMADAMDAAELAQGREDWRAFGTHSLRFHQCIVSLLASPLFDQFFANIAAQLRLAFAMAPDEERFQRPWVQRDRHLHALLGAEQPHEAAYAMANYLDDSERLLLELLSTRPSP
ncbi:GntR family transcriptional regulator [Pseudomonas sp. NPDC007930]|uniref:GntR family transcriptional regulator n=1 Tax=Pseudomonas sp. NPDC007930 TaxID=3364417 RepID=UPI0036E5E022